MLVMVELLLFSSLASVAGMISVVLVFVRHALIAT